MTALLMIISGAGIAYGGFRLMATGDWVGTGLICMVVGAVLGLAGLILNHEDHTKKS